jgi:hypothetical protein
MVQKRDYVGAFVAILGFIVMVMSPGIGYE